MIIDERTVERIRKLGLPERNVENNEFIIYSCFGDDKRADPKFNIQVYQSKKGLKLVTNDFHTYVCLMENKPTRPERVERTISIDDSGVGFMLGGVLCGLYDTKTDKIFTAEVPVKFFQGLDKIEKKYNDVYAKKAVELVKQLNPDKKTTLIRICTGYINVKAKEELRKSGFFVEVCEIKGKLQDELENLQKKYVEEKFGYPDYIDPKHYSPKELAAEFRKLKRWVIKNNMQKSCKDTQALMRHH
ncbi:hypothetical protein KY329_03625 [Candidatus Woesearchaeota archaeon]|nr:hypothetical protein [Candidatus Woesearchaeota archaeon]